MKLALFLALLGTMQVSASVYAQSTKLTLKLENKALVDLFNEIKKQSDFTFAYRVDDVKDVDAITISCSDYLIDDVLKACLGNTNLTYKIIDNVVVISKSESLNGTTQQEKITIKGKVVDKAGLPLPGVTIVIKENQIGTATGADGTFDVLTTPMDQITLVISFIGM